MDWYIHFKLTLRLNLIYELVSYLNGISTACDSVSYSLWHWVLSTLEYHTHPMIHESHLRHSLILILRLSLIHDTVSQPPADWILWTREFHSFWDPWVSSTTLSHIHPEIVSYEHLNPGIHEFHSIIYIFREKISQWIL